MVEAYNERQREHQQDVLCLAWYTAALSRQKKLPKLDKLLGKPEKQKRRRMTPEEMIIQIELINKSLGGAVH